MPERRILKNGQDGEPKLIKSCYDSDSFIKAAKSILSNEGMQLAEVAEIKTETDAMQQLTARGYHIGYFTAEDIYNEAMEEAPHLATYIKEMQEEERKGGPISLSKIKIDRKAETGEVFYFQGSQKNSKEVKFNGYERTTIDFLNKFRSMTKFLVEVLKFPEDWQAKITTTGLSLTYKDECLMGMVITAQMDIDGLSGPLNLNTPFVKFASWASSNDCCDDVVFSMECENVLEKIFEHTKAYMKGDTREKQGNLFEQEERQ